MNTRTLALFTTVAALGSITEAANRLRISQPAVSMQLRRLEDELGVTLFSPNGRGIALTDAGKTFLEHATSLLAAEEQLLRSMEEYREGRNGHIVLGASPPIGTYVLPSYISSFTKAHPGINLELRICPEQEIEKLVKSGQIDIGIIASSELDHLSFRVMTFCPDRWIVVRPVGETCTSRLYVEKELPIETVVGNEGVQVMEAASSEIVKEMVIAGLGWGVLLQSAVHRELKAGLLQTGSLQDFPRQTLLSLVTRPAERLSKSIWSFLEHVTAKKSIEKYLI